MDVGRTGVNLLILFCDLPFPQTHLQLLWPCQATWLKEMQSLKAPASTSVRCSGNVTSRKELQPWKVPIWITRTRDGT